MYPRRRERKGKRFLGILEKILCKSFVERNKPFHWRRLWIDADRLYCGKIGSVVPRAQERVMDP